MTIMASLLLAVCSGCGGFNGSKSVSPGSFLIPGLLKNEVPTPPVTVPEMPQPLPQPVSTLASLR